VLNPVLDACLALATHLDSRLRDNIESIELTGHPLLRQRTDRPHVKTGRESQVSAQHAVPVALLYQRAGLESFSDAAVNDPATQALGTRLRFHDDESYPIDSAKVVLRFKDAPPLEEYVPAAKGSLERPLTDSQLEAKLQDLGRYGRSGCDVQPLIDAIWLLDETDDAGHLAKLAAAA